jgi:hypothetical protein
MRKLNQFLTEIFTEDEKIIFKSGHGILPGSCPNCQGILDFGRLDEDELICRNKCGWKFTKDNNG